MSRFISICLVLGLVMPLSRIAVAGSSSPHPPERNLRIRIRLYNYGQVPDRNLVQAERVTERIFQAARIETVWLDCLADLTQDPSHLPCRGAWAPADLVLRILSERGSERKEFRDSHMGFALPSEEGGIHASIFYPDVQSVAENEGIMQDQLLGHAIAHEIGHLLLNSSAHSSAGLMRARWNSKDLVRATQGDLLFNVLQAEAMRGEVLRRIARLPASQNFGSEVLK
jgi:hypothetical protein